MSSLLTGSGLAVGKFSKASYPIQSSHGSSSASSCRIKVAADVLALLTVSSADPALTSGQTRLAGGCVIVGAALFCPMITNAGTVPLCQLMSTKTWLDIQYFSSFFFTARPTC